METSQRQLTPELFEPVGEDFKDYERIAGPSIGFWRDSWQRFKKNRASLVGLVVIVALVVTAYVAPLLVPYSPYAQDMTKGYLGTSAEHLMGTDKFGRDMFVRVWEGMRVSLYIALLAAFFDLAIGVPFGAISGLLGGKVDGVMQRIIEILNGIPNLVIAILVMLVLDPGIVTISVAIGIAGWTSMARIIRGRVMQLRDQEADPLEAPASQLTRAHHYHVDAHHPLGHLLRGGLELYRARHTSAQGLTRVPDQRRLPGAQVPLLSPVVPRRGVQLADAQLQLAGRWPARRPRPEDEEVRWRP
jgi:hypothetical protein